MRGILKKKVECYSKGVIPEAVFKDLLFIQPDHVVALSAETIELGINKGIGYLRWSKMSPRLPTTC